MNDGFQNGRPFGMAALWNGGPLEWQTLWNGGPLEWRPFGMADQSQLFYIAICFYCNDIFSISLCGHNFLLLLLSTQSYKLNTVKLHHVCVCC